MTRREWALKILGLDIGASDVEIREAYRDLVAVWHPDKHATNERLRQRAEAMMKRLNVAREILLGTGAGASWVDGEEVPADEPPDAAEEPAMEPETDGSEEELNTPPVPRRKWGGSPVLGWIAGLGAAGALAWLAFGPEIVSPIWVWEKRFWAAPTTRGDAPLIGTGDVAGRDNSTHPRFEEESIAPELSDSGARDPAGAQAGAPVKPAKPAPKKRTYIVEMDDNGRKFEVEFNGFAPPTREQMNQILGNTRRELGYVGGTYKDRPGVTAKPKS